MRKFYEEHLKNISKGTVIRTVTLLLAIVNSVLELTGKSPLPIDNAELEEIISDVFLYGSAVVSWWYNNSFTKKAIEADKTFK